MTEEATKGPAATDEPATDEPTTETVDTRLAGRYQLRGELGRGGMGVVYRAHDELLDRRVAIKTIPSGLLDDDNERRFRREARTVAQLDHPGIVPIHDFGLHQRTLFLVMPLVQGNDLRTRIKSRSLLLGEILEIAEQIALALGYSHAQGVIHRDVKPGNILVTEERRGLRVRVTDFGLARESDATCVTRTGGVVGTLTYMSPEQVNGADVDFRTDLYALGVVLYECLAGEPPFTGAVGSLVYRVVHEHPQPLRHRGIQVPAALDQLVLGCLAKDPAVRPASAEALAEALRGLASELAEEERGRSVMLPAAGAGRPRPPRSRLVGHEIELRELQARLNAALAGECQLVLVEGETGIGKTHLLGELERLAAARGIRVLHGHCADRRAAMCFQGFCEMLQDYFRTRESADVSSSTHSASADLSDLAPELMTFFPALAEIEELRAPASRAGAEAEPELDGPRAPRRGDPVYVFELLARTLTRLAAGKPLVLILEQMHRGEVSLDAVEYLVRRLGPTPTMFVGTWRSEEIGRDHAVHRLLASFEGDSRCGHLVVAPLDRAQTGQLIALEVGSSELDGRLAERIYQATGGNPFFARELVRSLRASGDLRRDESSQWTLSPRPGLTREALPSTVRQVARKRLRGLSEETRKVLATASVLGRSFDADDLEELVEAPDLDDMLDRLIEDGILEEMPRTRGDCLSFASGVVADVLYRELSRRKRRRLHRRCAERLEERHAGRLERVCPRLLYHFSAAEMAAKTVTYSLRLAQRALLTASPEDAVHHCRTALDLLGDDEAALEGELRLVLARGHREAGRLDEAAAEARRARRALARAGATDQAAEAALLAAEAAWHGHRSEQARRSLEHGLALARGRAQTATTTATLEKLLALSATLANLRGEYRGAQSYLEEAESLSAAEAAPRRREPVPEGGTLITALPNPVATLDPAELKTGEEYEVAANVYQTLFTTSADGVLQPHLCESWEASADGSTFRFRLRPEVCFSDGTPLRSGDVRVSLERCLHHGVEPLAGIFSGGRARAAAGGGPGEIEVRGEREIILHLGRPLPILAILLSNLKIAIVREVEVAGRGQLLGTGPFILARHDQGMIRLERNPSFWRRAPRLDAIEFRTSASGARIAAELRAGEIDLGRDFLPRDLEQIQRDPRFRSGLVEATRKNIYFVLFNASGPVARSLSLRRALTGSVRVQDLVWRTLGRFARPAVSFLPPGILGHDPGRRAPTLSRDQSHELLERAGLDRPIRLRAAIHPLFRDRYASLREELFAEWQALGVEVEDATPTMAEFLGAVRDNREIDLRIGRWIADYDDPDDFCYNLFHAPDGLFHRYFSSAETDQLLERARRETEITSALGPRGAMARAALYRQFTARLEKESILIPLFHDVDYRIAGPRVRGLKLANTLPYVNYAEVGKTATASGVGLPAAPGGEIHVPIAERVMSLDPSYGPIGDYYEASSSVFEALTRIEESARAAPRLAETIEASDDGRRYLIRLRPKVLFHDGRRLTTRDVRYSFERVLRAPKPEMHCPLLPIRGARALRDGAADSLEGLEIRSELELAIELERPLTFFPVLLASPGVAVVAEGSDRFTGPRSDAWAGTGPFRVLRFDPGERLELERNPEYWLSGFPKSDRLIFHFGRSSAAIAEDFRHGRLSLARSLAPAELEVLRRDPESRGCYRETQRLATYFLALNPRRGVFADLDRRRALARVLDLETACAVAGRLVTRAHGLIPPGLLGHEPGASSAPEARAAEVLRGLELRAAALPPYHRTYAVFWQQLCRSLRHAGVRLKEIEADLRAEDFRGVLERLSPDLLAYRLIADYPDADGIVGTLLHSKEGYLGSFCGTPALDPLIEAGRGESNPALRHAIYREIEETIAREAILIPLFHEQIALFCRPEVAGLRFGMTSPQVCYDELVVRR